MTTRFSNLSRQDALAVNAALEQARVQHAQYPQYKGYWDGPEWVVVRFTENVRTKAGQCFLKGDVTLATRREHHTDGFCMAYSFRTNMNTSVPFKAVEVLSGSL